MIVPYLTGGLGNQMFQIAAAYAYAKEISTDIGINYNIKTAHGQGHSQSKYKDNFYSKIPVTNCSPRHIYKEPTFHYNKIPTGIKFDTLLFGYYQSDKYFSNISKEIKNLFVFDDSIKLVDLFFSDLDLSKKTIGIHVRRGDYKLFPKIHPIQTIEYYKTALSMLDYEKYNVVLCTDEIESTKKDFSFNENIRLFNSNKDELADLYMLSQCDSLIICNSSFSWWGAYLGKVKENVICPKIWFNESGPRDFQDIYCEGWIKI